jgi:hypothetical protein
LNNAKRITVRAASKLLANTMFSYRGMGLSMVGSAVAAQLPHTACSQNACSCSLAGCVLPKHQSSPARGSQQMLFSTEQQATAISLDVCG